MGGFQFEFGSHFMPWKMELAILTSTASPTMSLLTGA
jgi:hypothetical protein